MIPTRTYTETENRNPEIYLGIDGSDIPFHMFKGVYLEDGLVFTDDAMYGIQFIVNKEKECVNLVCPDPDMYVTKEDVDTDEWIIAMRPLHQNDNPWTITIGLDFFIRTRSREAVYNIYKTGRQGLLKNSEKLYDDENIYYMKYGSQFDTRRRKDSSLVKEVERHVHFIYEGKILTWENQCFMHTKKRLWDKLIAELKEEKEKLDKEMMFKIKGGMYFEYGDYKGVEFIEAEIDGKTEIVGFRAQKFNGTVLFVEGKTNYFYITRDLNE